MAPLTSPSIHDYSDDTKLAILLVPVFSSFLLVSVIVCACCVGGKRKKKNDQKLKQEKPIVEKRKSIKEGESKQRKSLSERDDPTMKTIMQVSPDHEKSFLRLPSRQESTSPSTVITSNTKFVPKTGRSKALPPIKRSIIQPVRYNDPAYRTLGRDVDDPFGMSVTLIAEKEEISPNKIIKEKEKKQRDTPTPQALLASKKSDRLDRSVTCRTLTIPH